MIDQINDDFKFEFETVKKGHHSFTRTGELYINARKNGTNLSSAFGDLLKKDRVLYVKIQFDAVQKAILYVPAAASDNDSYKFSTSKSGKPTTIASGNLFATFKSAPEGKYNLMGMYKGAYLLVFEAQAVDISQE